MLGIQYMGTLASEQTFHIKHMHSLQTLQTLRTSSHKSAFIHNHLNTLNRV